MQTPPRSLFQWYMTMPSLGTPGTPHRNRERPGTVFKVAGILYSLCPWAWHQFGAPSWSPTAGVLEVTMSDPTGWKTYCRFLPLNPSTKTKRSTKRWWLYKSNSSKVHWLDGSCVCEDVLGIQRVYGKETWCTAEHAEMFHILGCPPSQ